MPRRSNNPVGGIAPDRTLDSILAGLEDHVDEMDDADIEVLDEVGRRVIGGDSTLTKPERRALRRLSRRFL